jgi:hypothetical protein
MIKKILHPMLRRFVLHPRGPTHCPSSAHVFHTASHRVICHMVPQTLPSTYTLFIPDASVELETSCWLVIGRCRLHIFQSVGERRSRRGEIGVIQDDFGGKLAPRVPDTTRNRVLECYRYRLILHSTLSPSHSFLEPSLYICAVYSESFFPCRCLPNYDQGRNSGRSRRLRALAHNPNWYATDSCVFNHSDGRHRK